MRFHYFYHNEFIHVLNPSTHRLFKRVDEHWVELRHPNEVRCFRLNAVELAPSEVPHHAPHLLSSRATDLSHD